MSELIQILIISLSLALDAFSVSIIGGARSKRASFSAAFKVAFFFGFFQSMMPLIGLFIGKNLRFIISSIDHWIAFILLFAIGARMIAGSFKKKDAGDLNILNTRTLLVLSIATSIDALVVGIAFEYIQVPLLFTIVSIGIITFVLCFMGFMFGKKLGSFLKGKIEILGGLALIGIGLKILISHLVG